jgi:NADH dehydrogenase
LLEHGQRVRVLTRNAARASGLASTVEICLGDVRERATLDAAVCGTATVVSAVQGFAGPEAGSPESVDRDGNANLIDAAARAGADVVLVSVVGAAADSRMDLFRAKHEAETHLRAKGMPWTIVRASAFLETWIGILDETAGRSGRPVVLGRGETSHNFVSVRDVAVLLERAVLDRSTRGATFEAIGSDDLTFNQLAAAVQKARGWSAPPRHVPRAMLRAMGALLRPFKPDVARQCRAALYLDTTSTAVDAGPLRTNVAASRLTTLCEVLLTPATS